MWRDFNMAPQGRCLALIVPISVSPKDGLTVRHESRSGLRCGRRSPRAQPSLHRGWNAPGMRDICPGLRDFAVPTWWAHAEFACRLVRKTAVPLRETKVSANTFTSYCELNRYRIAIAPREIRSPTGNRDLRTRSWIHGGGVRRLSVLSFI